MHAGKISLVGVSQKSGKNIRWHYFFAGGTEPVPKELLYREVGECCQEHISKLAKVVLKCVETFPHHTCYKKALTKQGCKALDLDLSNILQFFGYPKDWLSTLPESSFDDALTYFRDSADGVSINEIKKISDLPKARKKSRTTTNFENKFIRSLIKQLETTETSKSGSQLIGEAILGFEENDRD